MYLGALGPFVGFSWLALASICVFVELVLLACLASSHCLSDVGRFWRYLTTTIRPRNPINHADKCIALHYKTETCQIQMCWVCSCVWYLVCPSACLSFRFFFFSLLRSCSVPSLVASKCCCSCSCCSLCCFFSVCLLLFHAFGHSSRHRASNREVRLSQLHLM